MCTDRRRAIALILLLVVATGCNPSIPRDERPAVDIRVVADSSLTGALSSSDQLAIELSGAEQASLFFDGEPVGERILRYRPRATSGELAIAATVRASDGRVLGRGQASVGLHPAVVMVTLTLSRADANDLGAADLGGASDLGTQAVDLAAGPDLSTTTTDLGQPADLRPSADLAGPPGDLAGVAPIVIGPPTPSTFVGGTQAFVADEPVSWSVDGDTATIGANGVFQAPSTPGTHTVRATSLASPARQSTTTITVQAGAIDLIAGAIGTSGTADNPGVYARFYGPYGMTSDGAGTLYITEEDSHTVRAIDIATATPRTIAGFEDNAQDRDGIGIDARFCNPTGIARVGPYLYLGDDNCNAIRRVEIATGVTITFAGDGGYGEADGFARAAKFHQPRGLATDGSDALWVADAQAIRRIDIATGSATYGQVTTIAGDNTGGPTPFSQLSGLAWVGPAPGALYALDRSAGKIFKITNLDAATATVTDWAGDGTQGSSDSPLRMNRPHSLWATPTRLYFTDDSALRAVDIDGTGAAGAATTLAGAVTTSGYVDGVGTAARFANAYGIALEGGVVYIADNNNHLIRTLDVGTSAVTTFAGHLEPWNVLDGTGTTARFGAPHGIAYVGGSIAYVADNSCIRRVDFTTGQVTTPYGDRLVTGSVNGNGTTARFKGLFGLSYVAPTLYAADASNNNIRAIDLNTNEVTTFAGDPSGSPGYADGVGTSARFEGPFGLATDGGALYVVGHGVTTVRRIDLATRQVTTFAGTPNNNVGIADGIGINAGITGSSAIAYERDALWFGDSSCLRRLDTETRAVTTVLGCGNDHGDGVGFNAGIGYLSGDLIGDGAGHLLINDFFNASVRRYDVDWGTLSTLIGRRGQRGLHPRALPSTVNTPYGIALIGPTDLLLTDDAECAVVRVH